MSISAPLTVRYPPVPALRPAAGPGGAQPHHRHRGAAAADGLAADHRLLQRAGQHGDVAAQHGGGQQVSVLESSVVHGGWNEASTA